MQGIHVFFKFHRCERPCKLYNNMVSTHCNDYNIVSADSRWVNIYLSNSSSYRMKVGIFYSDCQRNALNTFASIHVRVLEILSEPNRLSFTTGEEFSSARF